MTEHMQRTLLLGALALLVACAPLACGDGPRAPERRASESAAQASPSLPPARYVTVVAWSAGGGRPSGALWLENRTTAVGDLHRTYRGWRVDGDTVRSVLAVRDTLPVAAAAWRPLPAPGFRISVDQQGRLASLTVGPGDLRLRLDRDLASWRGATGADQRLRRGRLLGRGADTAGAEITAAVLRFERLPGGPGPAGPARTLLLSGPDGRGLLILDEGAERPWSRGWTWDGEGRVTALDASALPDTTRGEGAWTFGGEASDGTAGVWRLPGGDSLAPARPDTARSDSAASFRVLPASGRVPAGGAGEVAARGYLMLAPRPPR